MLRFNNLDELKELVSENDNLQTVTMAELRDAIQYERLSNPAVTKIEEGMRQRAMSHFPALTLGRYDEIRVFNVGTPIGNLIEAVLTPSMTGDKALREAASNDADRVLRQIREMVCD